PVGVPTAPRRSATGGANRQAPRGFFRSAAAPAALRATARRPRRGGAGVPAAPHPAGRRRGAQPRLRLLRSESRLAPYVAAARGRNRGWPAGADPGFLPGDDRQRRRLARPWEACPPRRRSVAPVVRRRGRSGAGVGLARPAPFLHERAESGDRRL